MMSASAPWRPRMFRVRSACMGSFLRNRTLLPWSCEHDRAPRPRPRITGRETDLEHAVRGLR